MRAVEYIEKVKNELERLKAKYCPDCLKFSCEWCTKMLDSDDEQVATQIFETLGGQ